MTAMSGCPFHHQAASPEPSVAAPVVPSALPVSKGNLSEFAADPLACMRRLQAEHGPMAALEEDGRRVYFIFDPELNRQVLADSKTFHSRFFAVRGPKRSAHRRLSAGLLSMNGAQHKEHRRLLMEPFQKRSITTYFEDITQLTDELMAKWDFGGSKPRDINADMTAYLLRLTCSILFGLDDAELAYRVGELTEDWVHLNHTIGPAAFSPDKALTDRYDELLDSAEDLESALKEMVAAKRANGLGHDVLSILIEAFDQEGLDEESLLGQMAILFGAAHLTSAHTLTWFTFLLSQHPQERQKVADELDSVLDQSASGRRDITFEDIDSFPVLERTLKEQMRMLPASAYSQRITHAPVQVGPFKMAAGSPIIFSQFMTHHLESLYERPESFEPDRWKSISPGPYEYLPFGGGMRRCIGAPLAMMQFMSSLPRILSRYQFTMQPHCQVDARVVSTMLNPMTPVMMSVEKDRGDYNAQPVTGSIHELVDLSNIATTQRQAA